MRGPDGKIDPRVGTRKAHGWRAARQAAVGAERKAFAHGKGDAARSGSRSKHWRRSIVRARMAVPASAPSADAPADRTGRVFAAADQGLGAARAKTVRRVPNLRLRGRTVWRGRRQPPAERLRTQGQRSHQSASFHAAAVKTPDFTQSALDPRVDNRASAVWRSPAPTPGCCAHRAGNRRIRSRTRPGTALAGAGRDGESAHSHDRLAAPAIAGRTCGGFAHQGRMHRAACAATAPDAGTNPAAAARRDADVGRDTGGNRGCRFRRRGCVTG